MRARSLLAIALAMGPLAPLPAQDLPPSTAPAELPPNGTEIFRGLLEVNGIKPWNSSGQGMPTAAENILVIVYGDPGPQAGTIRNLVGSYHAVVALRGPYDLDQIVLGSKDRMTDTEFMATEPATKPEVLPDPQGQQCPFVVPLASANLLDRLESSSRNPFGPFTRIATRQPSMIRRAPRNEPVLGMIFEPVATLPRTVRNRHALGAPPDRRDVFAILGERPVLSVRNGQRTESKRLTVIMADEHPFSNGLLALDGTDNLAFAMGMIKNFKARGVMQCLFFEYGEPKTSFDDVKFRLTPSVPPLPIPPPPIADMIATQIADQAADQMDKSNFLNNVFRERPLWLGRLIAFGLGVILIGLTWTVVRRVWGRFHQPDQVPMPVHPFAKIKTAAGMVGQLQRDVIVGGDYGPVVRDYLRDLFVALGYDPQPGTPMPALPPPLKYEGKRENAGRLIQDFAAAWRIYAAEDRISLAMWKELEPKLVKLWKSAQAGRWRFA